MLITGQWSLNNQLLGEWATSTSRQKAVVQSENEVAIIMSTTELTYYTGVLGDNEVPGDSSDMAGSGVFKFTSAKTEMYCQ